MSVISPIFLVFESFLFLGFYVCEVPALKCFKCDHNEIGADNNFVLDIFLEQISKVDHPECKLISQRDRHYVDIIECPPVADFGNTYVCGAIRGTVAGTYNGLAVSFKTLVRDCVQVPAGRAVYQDRCVDRAVMDGPTQLLLNQALSQLEQFDVHATMHFKGTTCFDTNGVPESGGELMCPTCSYNELLAVDSKLWPVVEILQRTNSHSCPLNHTKDKFNVAYRICKPGYQGETNKCAKVQGHVHAKIFSKFRGGIDFRYKTLSRGCAQVDLVHWRNRDNYVDGCHQDPPLVSHVRKILIQGYRGADMGSIKFNGKVCYNNETFTVKKPDKSKLKGNCVTSLVIGWDSIGLCLITFFLYLH